MELNFGVCLPNYGEELSEDAISFFSKKAEDLGYKSAWTTDHLLMSAGSNTPYEKILESITTLVFVAAKTEKIRLGVSSLVMALRNPIVVAKQLATLDFLSNGRAMLATGAGWNEREFFNLGADYRKRGKRLNESIRLIRQLWESEGKAVSFSSDLLGSNIDKGIFLPIPKQRKLEVWIAGTSEYAMKRAIRLGDAWHPNVLPFEQFDRMVGNFKELEKKQEKKCKICVRVSFIEGLKTNEYTGPQGEKRFALSDEMTENERAIEHLRSIGVSYIVIAPNPTGKVSVSKQVEIISMLADRFVERGKD